MTIECYDGECVYHSTQSNQDDGPFCYEPFCKKYFLKTIENDLCQLEDGFYYFCPSNSGAISEWQLRFIADELERLNKPWEEQIAKDLLGEEKDD